MTDGKLAKIRTLAERGATEGEREAAREALRRLEAKGIKEDSQFVVAADMAASEVITIILSQEDWWRFMTTANTVTRSTNPNHGGRVWFESD